MREELGADRSNQKELGWRAWGRRGESGRVGKGAGLHALGQRSSRNTETETNTETENETVRWVGGCDEAMGKGGVTMLKPLRETRRSPQTRARLGGPAGGILGCLGEEGEKAEKRRKAENKGQRRGRKTKERQMAGEGADKEALQNGFWNVWEEMAKRREREPKRREKKQAWASEGQMEQTLGMEGGEVGEGCGRKVERGDRRRKGDHVPGSMGRQRA